VTLSAQWTAITYRVAYDKNAGDAAGTMDTSGHTYNQAKNLSANSFTKTGYAFAGWNTRTDGSGTSYSDSQNVTNLSSANGATVTLYARWTAITYRVAYDKNAGDAAGTMDTSGHTYNQAKNLSTNSFTKTGYAFAGWKTAADGSGDGYTDGASVTNLSSTDGATVTLYAQWRTITYTVEYNTNGGSGATESSVHTYNEGKALTANSFTRNGFIFDTWNTEANGSGTSYADGESVTNLSSIDNGIVTLYAQWRNTVFVNIIVWVNEDGNILLSGNDRTISKSGGPGLDIPTAFSASVADSYGEIQWELNGTPIGGTKGTDRNFDVYAKDYDNGTYILGVRVTKDGIPHSTDIRFTVVNN
jgi:uncharacterized repeat protein (TIGR02543 family)